MQAFIRLESLVVPLDRSNVDTDAIIPKQFIKSIRKTGFGPHLFDEWRYLDRGELGQDCTERPLNPDFALNAARYRDAQIMLARDNFGCGSSREHAVWALQDDGFRVVIAPSFADIFFNNCYKNGLLPIVLDGPAIDAMFAAVLATPGYRLAIDLPEQRVSAPGGLAYEFEVDAFRKRCLLGGLDEIALTLQQADAIRQYEAWRRELEPWLFNEPSAMESAVS